MTVPYRNAENLLPGMLIVAERDQTVHRLLNSIDRTLGAVSHQRVADVVVKLGIVISVEYQSEFHVQLTVLTLDSLERCVVKRWDAYATFGSPYA